MIGLLPTTTIFLATAPTDLRKAYDGLAVLVRQSLGQDPLSGSLYVFCNRRRDRIKILFWEEGGYWLCARRLERGTFRWPQKEGACACYRREELLLLLGGIDLKQTQARKWYRRASGKKQCFLLDSETDLGFSGFQMSETIELQGRAWQARELEQIRQWVAENPTWSRYRLSRELCVGWNWVRPNGQLADMAARSFLNKLHERALIQLPPCRRASPNRMKHRRLECVPVDSRPVEGELSQLGPLHLYEVSRDPVRRALFETLLSTEHYLSYRSPIGENLKYLLCTEQNRPVAAWLFGAAAWRCEPRDRWIGWNDRARAAGLHRLTNNTRFLIPRWVRVRGLASWGWSRVSRRLVADWQSKYGHGIELVETFVDRSRFRGCCYAASNWVEVGLTQGRSRGDRERRIQVPRKAVYVYPLSGQARQRLRR